MKNFCQTICFILLISASTAGANPAENREWAFRVLLDGKDVGSQRFVLTEEDGKTRLETEANFKVKFLFATVYQYMHRNVETWEGDCLAEIRSTTDANGKPYAVNGQRRDGYFEVTGEGQQEQLPECVSSFAYWDPSFLENNRLLNSQNGEYLDVRISPAGTDFLTVKGKKVAARKYHLAAGELDLHLWYSKEDEWLALESRTKGNRVLSYELL